MQTYPLSQLTEETLNTLVELHEARRGLRSMWEKMQMSLDCRGGADDYLTTSSQTGTGTPSPKVMNEATIWGRAIYPLLTFGRTGTEFKHGRVLSLLKATYPAFELGRRS